MRLRQTVGAASVCLILGLAGSALGQSQTAQPLSGPKVEKERPAHLEDRFSDEAGKGDKRAPMADRGVPMQAYDQILAKLRGDGAPEGLRLTPEQDQKIQAIEADFRQATRNYLQKVRRDMGVKDGDAQPEVAPGKGAARQLREEFRRDAPKPKDWQVKIWAVLTEGQQKFVTAEVATLREDMEKRRSEEYLRKQLEKRSGEAGKAAGENTTPAARPVAGQLTPEVRERARRVFERLQQLSPEQRQRILQKLEEELDRVEGGGDQPPPKNKGKGGKFGAGGGDDKPAPSVDTVKVPAPDRAGR